MVGQPGKPKPPGNPPEYPDDDEDTQTPIEETANAHPGSTDRAAARADTMTAIGASRPSPCVPAESANCTNTGPSAGTTGATLNVPRRNYISRAAMTTKDAAD